MRFVLRVSNGDFMCCMYVIGVNSILVFSIFVIVELLFDIVVSVKIVFCLRSSIRIISVILK